MKRFYKLVSHSRQSDETYAIMLDGKNVRTPARAVLSCVNESLADALVQEWAAQGELIEPDSMPLTQLAGTKIDRVGTERPAMCKALLNYVDTDLLCYRAEEPPGMPEAQAAAWDQWLDWFEETYGQSLKTTTSLTALKQSKDTHTTISHYVKLLDDDQFTVFQLVTSISGSLILAMAFMEGAAGPEEVFAAARVEENFKAALYNEEKYGPDPAQEQKDKAVLRDLEAAAQYLQLIKA